MERRSYTWFERRRRTKALVLAQEQITKALNTVTLLHQTIQQISEEKKKEAYKNIELIFQVEKEVDRLRTEVFKELSSGTALFTEYREDIMHVVKRLDTLADHVKDAARCVKILSDSPIPDILWQSLVRITSNLVECASALRESIKKIMVDSGAAIENAKKVDEIENQIDEDYLKIKTLFIKHTNQTNCCSLIIFNNLIEFVEQAADMCADTADYIVILASRE
jgi:predicted phosphate transport protein (TIGR00153 family)